MPRSWRAETKPHPFCPGCGHGIILRVLGEVVDDLGIADRTVYGCDIGCSLLSWNLFNLDTVQTHHGRTIPVIVGMKRARPDIVGIAYMGDGGAYAIGAQHLVSAAIRNEKITAIVCNNTVYAMTGGQLAPTTLTGQKTATTPFGRDPSETGRPISGPELVTCIGNYRVYAARGTVANFRQLKRFIMKAVQNQIEGQGFSFVEALSTCPTNWRTGPKETWRFLEHDMAEAFKIGEFAPRKDDSGANG
ncbi:MAG: thiamine pyrophosphate-dependent enzyme [Bacillota bacterium]